jgi:hypothetical protein
VPVSWLAILFIILSLAVSALEETDPVIRDLARGPDASSNIRMLSKRYRDAAMQCLAKQGVLWGNHNIQSLQALILMLYAMGHSQENTWALLGECLLIDILLATNSSYNDHHIYLIANLTDICMGRNDVQCGSCIGVSRRPRKLQSESN